MKGGLPTYPIVDLFAGPGGLGEGFAGVGEKEGRPKFRSVASIENNQFAYKTLLLRHFFRAFPPGEAPDTYYDYLGGDIDAEELFSAHPEQLSAAQESALEISLGEESHEKVRKIITDRLSGKRKWVLVGGPPCQAYSMAGRSRRTGDPDFSEDKKHLLYEEYLKIIIDHRPPVFVMENVKGLLSAKINDEPTIDRIVGDLKDPLNALEKSANSLHYQLFSLSEDQIPDRDVPPRHYVVRAERYGIPQARHRMFIVGVRSDVNVKPTTLREHKPPSVSETIRDLPRIRSGVSRTRDSYQKWLEEIDRLADMDRKNQLSDATQGSEVSKAIRSHLKAGKFPKERSSSKHPRKQVSDHDTLRSMFDRRLSVLNGHEARSHMPSDLRRYMFAATFAEQTSRSPKLPDFPVRLWPNHKNVNRAMLGATFADRFRVQLRNNVSKTVTSHISKDGHYYIHYDPTQCRSLTVREAARLQTFPDNFKFEGPRTEQYHQVGNAVPPYLAKQIGEVIADVLDSMNGKA
ncbi:MAG: DNA cytosine methyltransferase [Gammaproteobacteria bacterium]|nr:DNA cytosine methyltransferase [Gammaproteobacteria bacterium]MYD02710.1 DNA cytosine methyltransferase [Gammaproteobacteria bacterium]MYI25877.1 DNA cytosine methyltransferase [Gammaproteobacteria bacterium]